jgi:FAD/FMN-containing dehydrogenase
MDLNDLVSIVGADAVVTDPDRVAAHVQDWTGRWTGATPAVVLPADTREVTDVVRWCNAHGVAIVPQGGNTGMVGGSVPLDGELVLNLTRLKDLVVDADTGQATVGAGVTLAELHDAAHRVGWSYAVDLGARDSATIGGTVATNAGGIHVLRHGDTRHQLLGIEAVSGTGETIGDLRGLVKDNTGFDLPSLLAGSEGTLAVITRVCLRLVPRPSESTVALLGFESEPAALDAVGSLRRSVTDLQALELFFADGLELVCETFDLPEPFAHPHPAYLLLEAAGKPGVVDRLSADLQASPCSFASTAVAETAAQQSALWRYREAHTEAINRLGVPLKFDVTIPGHSLIEAIDDIRSGLTSCAPGAKAWFFGHAGDGNIHVNVTGAASDRTEAIESLVLGLAVAVGGSISAEHGIGRAKLPYIHLSRTTAELALYRRIKAAFDPNGILNPGVLVGG